MSVHIHASINYFSSSSTRKKSQVRFSLNFLVNVIIMIPDGFGPTSETFARQLFQHQLEKIGKKKFFDLPLDAMIVGSIDTSPLNIGRNIRDPRAAFGTPITDSSAGATAYACGLKTYNGAIAVDGEGHPCGTILEAAKLKGMRTGMVVTSRVSNATPAAFWGHALNRNMESLISEYLVGMHGIKMMNDVLIGGGICTFLPGGSLSIYDSFTAESCRSDSKDLLSFARKQHNASIYTSIEELNQINTRSNRNPIIGFLASDHMAYEIDRSLTTEPSLAEMTSTALKLLSPIKAEEEDHGFILMVEGSKIDMAAHNNDPAAHFHDIIAFQEAVRVAVDFTNLHSNTLVMVVSDHETGGLSIGCQVNPRVYPDYVWYPEEILRVRRSLSFLGEAISSFLSQNRIVFPQTCDWTDHNQKAEDNVDSSKLRSFLIENILKDGLGMSSDDRKLSDGVFLKALEDAAPNERSFTDVLSRFVSTNAQISWSTHGHTGATVNLYAYGYASSLLRGFHSNYELGIFLANLLDLDLRSVTRRLRERSETRKALAQEEYSKRALAI